MRLKCFYKCLSAAQFAAHQHKDGGFPFKYQVLLKQVVFLRPTYFVRPVICNQGENVNKDLLV